MKINFSHPNQLLTADGYVDLPIQADLTQDFDILCYKIRDVLLSTFPDLPQAGSVTITLPGASLLVAAIITVLHGITGNFPCVTPLLRGNDGIFQPAPTADLQAVRTNIRASRSTGTVVL